MSASAWRSFWWISLHLVAILLLCCCLFLSSLPFEFTFDDHLAIVNNRDVDPSLTRAIDLWRHDCWGKDLDRIDSHRSYRPLLILIFRLIRTLGGLEPSTFRLVSICAHGMASLLVYALAVLLTGDLSTAFASALLFVSHPVHVEGVVAVVNMAEPLSCCLFSLAFALYWIHTRSETKRWIHRIALTLICLPLGLLSIIGSLLIKETAVTATGVIIASSAVHLIGEIARTGHVWLSTKSWLPRHGIWVLMSLLVLIFYVALRVAIIAFNPVEVAVTHGLLPLLQKTFLAISSKEARDSVFLERSELIRKAENPFAFLQGQEKLLSMTYLHSRYLSLLIWPHPLSAEYSFDCIPKVHSISDPRNLYSVATYTSLLLALCLSFGAILFPGKESFGNIPYRSTAEILMHLLIWLVVSFIPASGVFLRLGTLLAERLLYTPSGTHYLQYNVFERLFQLPTLYFALWLYNGVLQYLEKFPL